MSAQDPRSLQLFFIIGCGRSGTTLLQSICMCAEGVHIAPETKFLAHFPPHLKLNNPAAWSGARARIEQLAQRDQMNMSGFQERWRLAPRSHTGLLRAWLESLAQPAEAKWIGDASNVHTPHVLWLAKELPYARFIHLFRDPRDVAHSQRQAWNTTPTRASMRWRRAYSVHERARKVLGAHRYHWLRYEDLVTDLESQVQTLCQWMGWSFNPMMLTPHLRSERGFALRERHKEGTLKPMTTSRIGRYKTHLASDEVDLIEFMCRGGMSTLGYRSPQPTRAQMTRAQMTRVSRVGLRLLKEGVQMIKEQLTAHRSSQDQDSS